MPSTRVELPTHAELQSSSTTEVELLKKKKKEEKAKEKELKKQKAAVKAEAAKLQAQQSTNASKKNERKKLKKNAEEEDPQNYVDPEMSLGEKKRLSHLMAKQYSPAAVEKSWYDWWENSGFFVAQSNSTKPPFVIVLPPPNVTGALHIALAGAIEDTIIRWRRMSGYNTLWVPGMDHAGIATQLEKKVFPFEIPSYQIAPKCKGKRLGLFWEDHQQMA